MKIYNEIEKYTYQRLLELDKQKDMQDMIYKGRLSLGVDKTTYGHLPACDSLVNKKKRLTKWFWFEAYFVSLWAVLMIGDYFSRPGTTWIQASLQVLVVSGVVMLFCTAVVYFNMFVRIRQMEREVRKLIYKDILFHLKTEKEPV